MSIKISNRPEELTPQGGDLIGLITDPSGARIEKKVTIDNLLAVAHSPGGGGGGGGTPPAGIDTQLQLNNAGAFGGANLFNRDYTNGSSIPSTMIDIVEVGRQQALKLWFHSDAVPVPANGEYFKIEFQGDSSDLVAATAFHCMKLEMGAVGTGLTKATEDKPYMWIDGSYGGLRLSGQKTTTTDPSVWLKETYATTPVIDSGEFFVWDNSAYPISTFVGSNGIGLYGAHITLSCSPGININGVNIPRDTFNINPFGIRCAVSTGSVGLNASTAFEIEFNDEGGGDPGYKGLRFKIWENSDVVSYYGPLGVMDLAHEKYILDAWIDGINSFPAGRRFAVTSMGAIKMRENDESGIPEAGIGQVWVKNTTPNELWFTDDAGTDTQIVGGGGGGGGGGGAFVADGNSEIGPTASIILAVNGVTAEAMHLPYVVTQSSGTAYGLLIDADEQTIGTTAHIPLAVKNETNLIFQLSSGGNITIGNSAVAHIGSSSGGKVQFSGGGVKIGSISAAQAYFTSGMRLKTGGSLQWSNSATDAGAGSSDVFLHREAEGILGMSNFTASKPQIIRIYNDASAIGWPTSPSSYERLTVGWAGNICTIKTEHLGKTLRGLKIGGASTDLLAFYGSTSIVQPAGTGETVGFTAGAGTSVLDDSTFTGNVGAAAYRISDIVKALKNLGLLAS